MIEQPCDKCLGPLNGSKYRRPDTPEMIQHRRRGFSALDLRMNKDGGIELNVRPPLCKPCWEEESPIAPAD